MTGADMIIRRHETLSERRFCILSRCERYRYALGVSWSSARAVNFIMLNPSTADERSNDPTVERCIKRAARLGHGAIVVTNLFAWRATDPADLAFAADPIGPGNDEIVFRMARESALVIAAWGTHGKLFDRARGIKAMLGQEGVKLWALGVNADGSPKHPLYVSYAAPLAHLPP